MLKHRALFLLILAVAVVAGCGGKPALKGIDQRESKLRPLPERDQMDRIAYTHFSDGAAMEAMGDIEAANRYYGMALKYYPRSPEIRYAYAATYFLLSDFQRALNLLADIQPRRLHIWLMIADCYRALGRNDSALFAYRESVKIDSNNVGSYHYLAAFYQQKGQLDSAIWAYENLSRLSPGYRVSQEIGNLLMRVGKLDEAEQSYFQSIALDPGENNVRSFLGLSVIYEERGDRTKAREYLEKAAALSPTNALIRNRLLGFYQEDGLNDKAIALAQSIVNLTPADLNAVRRLGMIYYSADSIRLADSLFTDLKNRGSGDVLDYFYSGRLALQLQQFERAAENFLRVTELADSVADGWLNLGITFESRDSIAGAIAIYEQALPHMRQVDDTVKILFSLASALERIENYDSATALFEKLILMRPDHAPSLNYLGYMLAEKGLRLDYARKLTEKALALAPDNGAYWDSHGWVLYMQGDYSAALESLLKAEKLIGDDPVVLEHIGDTYKKLGDPDKARQYWNRALNRNGTNAELKRKLAE